MDKNNSFQISQGLLSLGYIYLILMGILNESLYYNRLDIEILKYSNILDVLLSPISKLTTTKGLLFSSFLVFATYILPNYYLKKKGNNWLKKAFKVDPNLPEAETKNRIIKSLLINFAIGIFGFFIGTGIGGGHKIATEIKENKVVYNDTVQFLTGETTQVEIVGKNSSYLFYLTEDRPKVQVSPISGTIKSIEEVVDEE